MAESERPLAEALRRHGIEGAAAEAVRVAGDELRARTADSGAEFAATIDAATGRHLGEILSGDERSVDFAAHVHAMRADHKYVTIHSHPASSSFSAQDAVILTTIDSVRTSVVVGLDGTWYLLNKTEHHPLPTPTMIFTSFRAETRSLLLRYQALVRAGTMSPEAAWRQHSHEVWQTIATRLGLQYDRVEVT